MLELMLDIENAEKKRMIATSGLASISFVDPSQIHGKFRVKESVVISDYHDFAVYLLKLQI